MSHRIHNQGNNQNDKGYKKKSKRNQQITSHQTLCLTNPTKFPARVRVMVETAAEARTCRLPANFAANLPLVAIPAGGEVYHPAP